MEKFLLALFCLTLPFESVARSANVISLSQNDENSPEKVNLRPIIGILTQPSDLGEDDELIRSVYVQFLESAGARVVPIRGKKPPEYYRSIFKKINGVFFPGGKSNTTCGPYYESGKAMYDLAIKANDEGDYFPIWGTCLGLELMTVLTSGKWLMTVTDSENMTIPLTLVQGYDESRLLKNIPSNILRYLVSEPVTQNNHEFSLLVKDYMANHKLKNFYKVLATNHGRDRREFVSLIESYKYPFYASQWHPEKNAFMWTVNAAIDHSLHAIKVTQYFADFFVNEARKNYHHFDSAEEEVGQMIENYKRKPAGDTSFIVRYFFNYTQPLRYKK